MDKEYQNGLKGEYKVYPNVNCIKMAHAFLDCERTIELPIVVVVTIIRIIMIIIVIIIITTINMIITIVMIMI